MQTDCIGDERLSNAALQRKRVKDCMNIVVRSSEKHARQTAIHKSTNSANAYRASPVRLSRRVIFVPLMDIAHDFGFEAGFTRTQTMPWGMPGLECRFTPSHRRQAR
jgi:hypothetical protein